MTVGIDIGASAIKLVGYDRGEVIFTHTEEERSADIAGLLSRVLSEKKYTPEQVSLIAVTGVGAENCGLVFGDCKIVYIPELAATGEGGTWLAGKDSAVVVSLGTGTAIIVAKDGEFTHVGGSGVGAGTVRGLTKRLLGIADMHRIAAMAQEGDYGKVDVQIRDLFSGTDTLPLDLTASNMAKLDSDAGEADWAAAIVNLALEVAGSHGALAAVGFGLDTVIITGGLSTTKPAADCYAKFDALYPQTYIIPPHSQCATAIGAARRAERGM